MFIGFIYHVTNTVNGKMYIGKTIKPFDGRWQEHIKLSRWKRGFYLHRSIRKHGASAFAFEIVDVAFAEDELNRKECERIACECAAEPQFGYNCTFGGDGGKHRDAMARPDVHERISASQKEIWLRPGFRARRSATTSAANRKRFENPEQRLLLSAALKLATERPEVRAKISNASKANWKSPEHRARMFAARTTPEARERRRKTWERKFIASVAWG
jgi:group I intron endonuclease